MNYIVLDLEWNMADKKKDQVDLINEIIEIGAVKLDENLKTISYFDSFIKPVVHTVLNYHIKNVIAIDESRLICAKDFKTVFSDFIKWCGEDYVFCTWGTSDLRELQRNLTYHKVENPFPFPFKYYDIQEIFSHVNNESRTYTLNYATIFYRLSGKADFHAAINDARYTAKVMEKLDMSEHLDLYTYDLYRIANTREEEWGYGLDGVYRHYGRGFVRKEELYAARDIYDFACPVCRKSLFVTRDWSKPFVKSSFCLGRCIEHGPVMGRLMVKKNDMDRYYVIRIEKIIDEDEYEALKKK